MSHHTDVQDEGTIHEDNWWKLVEDFVTNFNEYHAQIFSPSDPVYYDESISRWYPFWFSNVCENGQESREWGIYT